RMNFRARYQASPERACTGLDSRNARISLARASTETYRSSRSRRKAFRRMESISPGRLGLSRLGAGILLPPVATSIALDDALPDTSADSCGERPVSILYRTAPRE